MLALCCKISTLWVLTCHVRVIPPRACTWVGEGINDGKPLVLDRCCMCVDGRQSEEANKLGEVLHYG